MNDLAHQPISPFNGYGDKRRGDAEQIGGTGCSKNDFAQRTEGGVSQQPLSIHEAQQLYNPLAMNKAKRIDFPPVDSTSMQCVIIDEHVDSLAVPTVPLHKVQEVAEATGGDNKPLGPPAPTYETNKGPEELSDGTLRDEFEIGDHVYQWRSWMGIPNVFQHHGIIIDIQRGDHHSIENDDSATSLSENRAPTHHFKLTIADFSNVHPSQEHGVSAENGVASTDTVNDQPKQRTGLTQEGILRTYTDTDKWYKVEYQAPWWKRSVFRAGTCTGSSSDAVGLVLARVNYILQHPDELPDYHVVNANCECVAVWCKTGRWSTLQASSFLEMTAAGQVKSSATLATAAATTQVTVQAPAAGLWGWLGFTSATQISWLTLHPAVIPALAGYAVFSVGAPAVMYAQARKQWHHTTKRLQDSFWEDAMANPEVFAECMTHWSTKNDG